MSKSDVPRVAALLTVFSVIWGIMVMAAFRSDALSGVIVLSFPFVCFAIWFAIKSVMMRVLFPNR